MKDKIFFLAKTDKKINEGLRHIDDIDYIFAKKGVVVGFLKAHQSFLRIMNKNKNEFKDLLKDIDSYKNGMKKDFDKIK